MINNLFLSVGAMKAGTTWLYEQLKDHPEIHFTPIKEIHYFANAVGIENQLNHRNRIIKYKENVLDEFSNANPKFISENTDLIQWYTNYMTSTKISNQWYKSLFDSNPGKHYCADFSNLYCQMNKDGWSNVRKVSKNIKVIYTLRDPLDRLWSHYKFHLKWTNKEDDVLAGGFEAFKELLEKQYFWVNSEYGKNFSLLKENLREEELMLLYFEDFRENPIHMLHNIESFLNIQKTNPSEKSLQKKVNKTKSFKFPDAWRAYALDKLQPQIQAMKKEGLWHRTWSLV